MTRVLIAVDSTDTSVRAAEAAVRLVGSGAEYLMINVAPVVSTVAWAAVGPYPFAMVPSPSALEYDESENRRMTQRAETVADGVAGQAGVPHAVAMGDVGDPVEAILHAAREHHVDLVVVGAEHRGFWARLAEGSVPNDVARRAEVPVLLVP